MLDELAKSNITNALRNQVKSYLMFYVPIDCRDVFRCMLLKDLGIKMNAKSINKVEYIIPTFDVALAEPIKKKDSKTGEYKWVKFKKDEWVSISLKLNGVRAVNIGGKFYTRTGHEITGFETIKKEIRDLCIISDYDFNHMVFDGELLIKNVDENGALIRPDDVNFRETTGIVNCKDRSQEDEDRFEFVIFDVMTDVEFGQGESKETYKERSKTLEYFIKEDINNLGLEHIRTVPIYYQGVYSKEKVEEILDMTGEGGFEGAMVNRDATYQAKRTKNLLKVKAFYENDLTILGFNEGEGEFKGTLGSITVNYRGFSVNVGSGFKQEERWHIWNNQDEYIGKICAVRCKGESQDKDGNKSMQFPTWNGLRIDKTKENYES